MFAYLWLSILLLLLIKVSGLCYEECNTLDIASCSRCLSHLSKNALNNTNAQSYLICNLWDSSECWMGWYNINVDQERIRSEIELSSGQEEIFITKLNQELKITSAEFIINNGEKSKQSVELNCSSNYLPGYWQSLGLVLKPKKQKIPLLFGLLGVSLKIKIFLAITHHLPYTISKVNEWCDFINMIALSSSYKIFINDTKSRFFMQSIFFYH